ncbi:MAG: roadblock/LC7 domain-containing protein [Candidatus Hodarchaeota archaeon]
MEYIEEDQEFADKLQQITNVLQDVEKRIPDIEGLVVVSQDGLPIASALSLGLSKDEEVDESRISAMTAATLMVAQKVSAELDRGEMDQIMIRGKKGLVIIMKAGEFAVLAGIAKTDAALGLVLLEMNRCAKNLTKLLV